MFALGLSFSLIHAAACANAISSDVILTTLKYLKQIDEEICERFRLVKETDDARNRRWRGETLQLAHADGCFPLFALVASGLAAAEDPDAFRAFTRRLGFLDRTAVFDAESCLHKRIEAIAARHFATAVPGLSRDQMLKLAQTSLGTSS